MTKHVHEWKTIIDWDEKYYIEARCMVDGCDKTLDTEDVDARLNATSRLPAYAAEQIADGMELQFEEGQTGYFRLQQLRAYADIWEGK